MGQAVLPAFLLLVAACAAPEPEQAGRAARLPNFVIVLTDDQGYGDVGCYGAEGVPTPNLDRMAAEGMRFTDFLVSQAVCSASRASLLTGCYAERVGIQGALDSGSRIGLNPEEETLAEILRARGYATGIFGKWHLGHHPPFLPLQHGFDEYFGLPYSNDMWPVGFDGAPLNEGEHHKSRHPVLRLIEGNEPADAVRTLDDQARLTSAYTERAVRFIEEHRERPFFLYLPHSMPHVPLGVSAGFRGRSEQGAYGDVIAEIDASLGRILGALDEHGLREDTLVVFTSDNGPWLNFGNHAGSAGPLREGKGTMWEGGARVPCIVRWPGRVPAGSECDRLAATIDLLPTIASLAGATLPEKPIDGVDITGLLEGRAEARPRRTFLYYYGARLIAVRRDAWKLVFPHEHRSYLGVEPGADGHPGPYARGKSGLELYDLEADLGETQDVAAQNPAIVRELEALADVARAELGDRLRDVRGSGARPPGRLAPLRASPIQHLAVGKSVTLAREPDGKYPGGGAAGLVDGVLGSEAFDDGTWLGYQGRDFEALVDLGGETELGRLACSFLQDQAAWIFLPVEVELAVSADGDAFEVLERFERVTGRDPAQETQGFEVRCEPRRARFVRVRAKNNGACPTWHAGAGGQGWLFVDELVVE
jgi:arylsulfatase